MCPNAKSVLVAGESWAIRRQGDDMSSLRYLPRLSVARPRTSDNEHQIVHVSALKIDPRLRSIECGLARSAAARSRSAAARRRSAAARARSLAAEAASASIASSLLALLCANAASTRFRLAVARFGGLVARQGAEIPKVGGVVAFHGLSRAADRGWARLAAVTPRPARPSAVARHFPGPLVVRVCGQESRWREATTGTAEVHKDRS